MDRSEKQPKEDTMQDLSLEEGAKDVRFLVNRGYPKDYAIAFVGDHRRLPSEMRHLLTRVVVGQDAIHERLGKQLCSKQLAGRSVAVDGYNVIITTESLLSGYPVYRCDDGFLRDLRWASRSYKRSDMTFRALNEILSRLCEAADLRILLDRQISMSGSLAALIRQLMRSMDIPGSCTACSDVDLQLKRFRGVVATADGPIIDCAEAVVDLPSEIAHDCNIPLLSLR